MAGGGRGQNYGYGQHLSQNYGYGWGSSQFYGLWCPTWCPPLFLLLLPLLFLGCVLWMALAVWGKLLPLVERFYSCIGCLGCIAQEDPEATPGPQAADLGEFLWSSVPGALKEQCFECDWFARIIAHPRIVRTRSLPLSVAIVVPQVMMIVVVGAATCAVRLALLCVTTVVYLYCAFWNLCCCVPLWDKWCPEQPTRETTRARRSAEVQMHNL